MLARDVAASLARIRERDAEVRAFVRVRQVPALGDGPLNGVPFGAKDIFDTQDMPTEYGSALFAGRQPDRDAGLVRRLRVLGAVLVGKTHTTAFAYFDPAPTRNPRNLEHTPGGSSSGSAAAVAAGMVPFALGTQTQGSVIRPASFCGVVGFKPTRGLLDMSGVLEFAPTLDTAGLFTSDVAGMVELWGALGYGAGAAPVRALAALPLPEEVEPPMGAAFHRAATRLGARTVEPPPVWSRLLPAVRMVNDYEGARTHRERREQLRGTKLGELVERGLRMPRGQYQEALAVLEEAARYMSVLYVEHPVLLWPAALGAAPRGLASTGDPRMNAPFTALGVPAISVPMPVADQALPLGLQLTAGPRREAGLLATAAMVLSELGDRL
jgi:Asp-tRNA(Asn)/Glu-tRNA(Gln) amidotransferase A subunit family amidase